MKGIQQPPKLAVNEGDAATPLAGGIAGTK